MLHFPTMLGMVLVPFVAMFTAGPDAATDSISKRFYAREYRYRGDAGNVTTIASA
jgi:hypothetical protein